MAATMEGGPKMAFLAKLDPEIDAAVAECRAQMRLQAKSDVLNVIVKYWLMHSPDSPKRKPIDLTKPEAW